MRRGLRLLGTAAIALLFCVPADAQRKPRSEVSRARTAQGAYDTTLARERQLRATKRRSGAPLSQMRALIGEYEALTRRFPRSGYADNALWNGANLAYDANIRFGAREDRDTAIRMLQWLVREYPSSSLARDGQARLRRISASAARTTKPDTARKAARTTPATPPPAATELANANIRTDSTVPEPAAAAANTPAGSATEPAAVSSPVPAGPAFTAGRVIVREVKRVVLPEVVRVTIELDGEVAYHEEALSGPDRLFFDLRGTQFGPALEDGVRTFDDGDLAREIRLGTHPGGVTRVVIDTRGVARHSLFTLYNPYRLVVDLYRPLALTRAMPPGPPPPTATVTSAPAPKIVDPLPSRPAAPPTTTMPAPPEANSQGGFSLARQLGLGVSRIVIDAGHGGHDPGVSARGLLESELVLDVSLRLEKLLKNEPGVDVVLTRRTDVFIPLEERTRIANRQNADLFLSVHANASRNRSARGVETYFLNFASNAEAEEVAARENSASAASMGQLSDIVKAITLNNKLDESKDLAQMVQESMVTRLKAMSDQVRDRGVKQAPFVVLIGAAMPSVLAEISFVSHPEEGNLLKSQRYRQEIAEALRDAVLRYQRSLKGVTTTAQRAGEQ